jgi:hypothetical protein
MQADIWGTTFHDTMLFLALDLGSDPEQEAVQETVRLLKDIAIHVPCPKCQYHAKQYLADHRFEACRDTDEVVQYLVSFHNSINRELGKDDSWTVERALDAFYDRNYSTGYFISQLDTKRREDYLEIQKLRRRVAFLETELGQSSGDRPGSGS